MADGAQPGLLLVGAMRGSAIIAVLLLISVFFTIGVALLARQVLAYRGAAHARAGLQALALAEAGLEDARLKLEKDVFYPPPGGPDQETFAYTEEVRYSDGSLAGTYQVTVDRTRSKAPYWLLRVRVSGVQGAARKTLVAEIDASPTLRGDPDRPNPDYFRILSVHPED